MEKILLILCIQLTYVPIMTLRMIFMVKNKTGIAALLGFTDSLIYVFGLSLIFTGERKPIELLVYAMGFGIGILIGGAIENKLAIGYNNIMVNLLWRNDDLIHYLREEGFGVTLYEGEGRDSKRYRLDILTKRSREDELIKIIEKYEPKAFIICYEASKFKGGFLTKIMNKNKC
ncbi:MAG: DUF2179 domain-containing protein [Peptostreptococcales bacterium]